jgi:hypothetical protein
MAPTRDRQHATRSGWRWGGRTSLNQRIGGYGTELPCRSLSSRLLVSPNGRGWNPQGWPAPENASAAQPEYK